MPVYAYKCKSCGHQLEVRQSFSDDPLTECPECGGDLRKQFNSVGVVFKGSGFYRTDSRSGASGSGSGSSGPGSDSGAASSTSSASSSSGATGSAGSASSSGTSGGSAD
ncbi:FmdB family zinc ribbon protein [Kocuria palustris]|uniref:FmdB family zinc ribbon protein n=1 Tax=Kocuria palustris TaxID=71999 RepID=UPI0011A3CAEB|nr:FmdB family zinc ribbon protein [Kocuria palustris]